jgi:hypothetical protein
MGHIEARANPPWTGGWVDVYFDYRLMTATTVKKEGM